MQISIRLLQQCLIIAIVLDSKFERFARASDPEAVPDRSRLIFLKSGVIDTTTASRLQPTHSFLAFDANARQHYIVQFTKSVSRQTKQNVRNLIDNDLTWYIPYNSFVVYATEDAVLEIQMMREVTWTGTWDPKYKYQPIGERHKAFLALDDDDSLELLITLPEVAYSVEFMQQIRDNWMVDAPAQLNCSFDVEIIPNSNRLIVSSIMLNNRDIPSSVKLNIVSAWFADRSEVYRIARRENFQLANYWAKSLVQNDDPAGRPDSSLLFAQHGIQGENQVIGMSDSGLSSDSCFFLDPNHDVNYTFVHSTTDPSSLGPSSHRKVIQYVVPSTGDTIDEDGHGTHVAGTLIGQIADTANGFVKFNGVAPAARVAFFDIQSGKSVALPKAPLYQAYFPYSYAMGARVNTNSWGSTSYLKQYSTTSYDVDKFVWDHPDMLLIFAAGNLGSSGVTPPATAKNVIAVGATVSSWNMFQNIYCYSNMSDSNACSLSQYLGNAMQDDLADFSSRGPTDDLRIKPDLVATGRSLVSAGRGCLGRTDSDLKVDQGTSMATPLVASHMLLVREYLMKGYLKNGIADPDEAIVPSAALLKAIAISGSFPIVRQETVSNGLLQVSPISTPPDNLQGFGRLKLNRVLYFRDNEAKHRTFIPRNGQRRDPTVNRTEVTCYTFCVAYKYSRYPPRFTLAWTDYPAQPFSTLTIVQDLDLIVNTSSDSTLYYGNGGASVDSINTVERVSLPGAIDPGVEITVRVKASSLPMLNRQPYALVATGRIVDTPCSVEFPGGVIPPERYVDASLPVVVPSSLWSALTDLNVSDRRVQLILGGFAIAITAIVCCVYCAFHYDDSCCSGRKKTRSVSSELIADIHHQHVPAGRVKTVPVNFVGGRAMKSDDSRRHQKTISHTSNPEPRTTSFPPIHSSPR